MSDKLPDKIIPISTLIINRAKRKTCQCRNRKFEIDTTNREVICQECGAIVDPYDALLSIATHYDQLSEEVKYLLEQRKKIIDWEPHLVAIRKLELIYRGGKMIPCCPHCKNGLYANELLISSMNKKYEEQRRKFKKKEGD